MNEMHVNFGARGVVEFSNAKVIFRNFEGRAEKYNREGDRNFSILIPNDEIADALVEQGWNVKVRPPREDGDEPLRHLKVKVAFGGKKDPEIYLKAGGKSVRLDADTVGILDRIGLARVDLDIRPYDWYRDGDTGRTAYLNALGAIQEVDRIRARYAGEEYPDEDSPYLHE